jgi:outer membrane protein assembly factor BamB
MHTSLPTLLAAAVLLAAGNARADWRQFRGPNGNGSIAGNARTPTTLSNETIAWKTPLPGRGLGSPIIVGDRVFVTAATGPEQDQLLVLCFDSASGEERWRRSFRATGRTMCNNKTCVAAPTPASDGKHVYALWSSNDLVCLDLDGNLQWLRGLTFDYPNASNSLGMASSPIIAGDTLVAQIENDSQSFAAGFDLLTGTNKWKLDRPKSANWTSPVIVQSGGRQVIALQSSQGVMGVSPDTGSGLWNYAKGAATMPSSAAAGDMLYVPSNGLTALRPGSADTGTKPLWNEKTQRPATGSPLVAGDRIYFTNSAGVLTAVERATGNRLWRIRVKGPFSSSPVACDNGHLYLFSEEGVGQCVDISGETGRVVSEIELGETILSTPSIAGDALYIRSDGHLWKFAK